MKISSVGKVAVAVAAVAIASQVAEAKPGRDKEKDEGASRFVAIAPCSVAAEGGGLRWTNGRHPFQGGNGAYGDIFFGGGASAVPGNSGGASSTATSSSGGNNGNGNGGGNSNGGGNGNATGGGGNSASGPGVNGSAPTVPTPNIGGVGVTASGNAGAAASNGRANVALATPAAVNPEPASLMLIGAGLGAVVFGRRRARQNKP